MKKRRETSGDHNVNISPDMIVRPKSDFFIGALHVFILFNFAVAQPLFDLLSRKSGFFIARHSEPIDVILLILILCVMLPGPVVMVEALAGAFGRRARKGLHGLVISGLVAVIALPGLKRLVAGPDAVLLGAAIISGVTAIIAYYRFRPARTFLTALSPALLIFPALFLFNSPVFRIVFPEKEPCAVGVKINEAPPIIMVVFDEFGVTSLMDEHRQIDPIRYPNFAALARDSYWFRNASTIADNTHIAIPAMLTGNYPDRFRMPIAACYPKNMYTLLGGSYELKVFEPMTQLCPRRLCGSSAASVGERMSSLLTDLFVVYLHIILPPGMSADLPEITTTWMDFRPVALQQQALYEDAMKETLKDRARQFEQFIDLIRPTEQPTLYFQHILLPHVPYHYLPSGKRYALDSGLKGLISGRWGDNVGEINQSYQRYLLQVGFVDTLIGKLIAHLKAVDLYDCSLIVITADHGVSFRPKDFRRALNKTNYGDIIQVPLFIKTPDQHKGIISDRNVETIDIFSTIADILDVQLPWPVEGYSALDLLQPERKEKTAYNDIYERFVFDPAFEAKYVTLDRKVSLFGSGSRPYGLFKIGRHNELVGRQMCEVRVAGQSDVEIQFDMAIPFADLDTKCAFVPAQIKGHAFSKGENAGRLDLAFAVNGVIRAVTQTSRQESNKAGFSAIVPENAFREGNNEVDVYVVSEKAGQIQLLCAKSRSIAGAYSLASLNESDEIITSPEGTSIPVTPKALEGYLDIAHVESDRVVFAGWAADVKNSLVSDAIIVFVDGEFFYAGRPNLHRPDVVKAFGDSALERSGFEYVFPLSLFKDIGNSEVRVFAVLRNRVASELVYPEEYIFGKNSLAIVSRVEKTKVGTYED